MTNKQPVLLRAVEAWQKVITPLGDRRLSCAETLLIIDLFTQTFALCRDRQELTWLSGELRAMVQAAREHRGKRNGKFH